MEYKTAIGFIFVIAMLGAAFASAGCTSSTVHRPGWIIPNPNSFKPGVLIGITFTFKVFVHVDISEPKDVGTDPDFAGFGSDSKYREYNVTCGVSPSWTPDTAQNAVMPITSEPVTDGSLPTYKVWSDSVKNWYGSTYNEEGIASTTTNGTDPLVAGQGCQTIEKPSRYLTTYGIQIPIDWVLGTCEALYNQVQTEFSFDILQNGMKILSKPLEMPLFVNLPTDPNVASIPDTEYTFDFYLPFGGRFTNNGFSLQTYSHSQAFKLGYKISYWVDPTTNIAAHVVNWAGDITGYWGHEFGDFLLTHAWLRLDYDICRISTKSDLLSSTGQNFNLAMS